jgi:hypothetical protein
MVQTKSLLTRTTAIVSAEALVSVALIPAVYSSVVHAGLPSSRSITMETSAAAATDVTYNLQFTTDQSGASSNIGGLVLDFCDSSPIIGDTCTAPSGLDVNKANLALGTQAGVTGFTVDRTNSTANKLVLTRTAGSVSSGVAVTIPLGTSSANDGITNPTLGNHTFYGRLLTFTTGAGAVAYTSNSVP